MALTADGINKYLNSNNLHIESGILSLILNKDTFEEGLVALKAFLVEKTRQFDIHKIGDELEAEKVSYDAYLTLLRLI